jgi:hypothetical protein
MNKTIKTFDEINKELNYPLITNKNLDELKKLQYNFERPYEIGFIGGSGIGKSTLLNKILGKSYSKTGASGRSCTQFPIRFKYGDTFNFEINTIEPCDISQEDLYTILSEYKDKDKIKFKDFKDVIINHINDNIEDIKSFDISHIKSITNTKKCKEIWDKISEEITIPINGKEYKFDIIKYFIKDIIIYLPIEILNTFTFTDLPGLNDKCSYRENITKEYVKNLDYIIIVDRACRLRDSKIIDEIISTFIKNTCYENSMNEIFIIGTCSDTIYDQIKKELKEECEDEDEDESDSDSDSEDEEFIEIIDGKYLKQIESIKISMSEYTDSNQISLNVDTYIISEKKIEKKINDIKNFMDKMKSNDNKIKKKLEDDFNKNSNRYIERIKNYINNNSDLDEKVYEDKINKLDNIRNNIIEKYNPYSNLQLNKYKLEPRDILTKLTELKSKFIDVHGNTINAAIGKGEHTSCNGTEYNLVEEMVNILYLYTNDNIYESNINLIKNNSLELKSKPAELLIELFQNKIYDKETVTTYTDDIKQLYELNEQPYKDEYTKIVKIIVEDNVKSFRVRNGNSNYKRQQISQLLNFDNIEDIKDTIIKNLDTEYTELNKTNVDEFNNEIHNILTIPPKDTNINREKIKAMLEEL